MENSAEIIVWILAACVGFIFAGLLLMKFIVHIYMPFTENREFIKLEILRTRGNERIHWQHELRRLYIGLIPFIGNFLVRKSREKGKKQREKL